MSAAAATPLVSQRAGSRAGLSSYVLAAPAVAWLAAFSLVPLGFMLAMSFWRSTMYGTRPAFVTDNYARLFTNSLYVGQLLHTLRIAAETTLISLLVSYPVALTLALVRSRVKALLVLMLFLPFWTSYVVRTFVWLPILGRNGIINGALTDLGIIDRPLDGLLYGEGAVLLGLVYVYTLFMTLPIYLALERLDRGLIEAARDLGGRPFQVFTRVILPLSMPGVLSGSVMVFLLAAGAYVTPQLLGGPSGNMFGNIIASQFLSNNNWAFGSALAVSLMLVLTAILLVTGRYVSLVQVLSGGRP